MPVVTRKQTLRVVNRPPDGSSSSSSSVLDDETMETVKKRKPQVKNGARQQGKASLKFRVSKSTTGGFPTVKRKPLPLPLPLSADGPVQRIEDTSTAKNASLKHGDVLQKAYAHLIAADARMGPWIDKFPCTTFAAESINDITEPFMGLSCSIISQQVSGAAASSIRRRFIELFNPGLPSSVSSTEELDYFPSPSTVAKTDISTLRTAGLSQRKAEYIQGLAEKFAAGELSKEMLAHAPYEQVLEKLVSVRGIGQWTVEMFACFGLKRLDIFSVGDLAVQRGMAAFMGKNLSQLRKKEGKGRYLSEGEMLDFSEKFAPYRSLFMWYMWRIVENISVEALNV